MRSQDVLMWCFVLLTSTSVRAEFRWIDDKSKPGFNCDGKVSDAVCCKDNFCQANSEADCKAGRKMFLCAWKDNKCTSFRDDANNVCCQSEVKDACDKVVRGLCPADWQVPENCCSALGRKWNGTLLGVKPGYVCCNAPCTEMEKAGCSLPSSCAPSQRSLGALNPFMKMGFNGLAQLQAGKVALGQVLQGTGFGGDYALSLLGGLGDGSSKKQQVDEITVDDLMSMLIESLSADTDAKVYNAELNTDPYLGKVRSGGSLVDMNLPDPDIFMNQIYGNPFGMSQANLGNFPSMTNPYAIPGYYGYIPDDSRSGQSLYGLPPPQFGGMMPPMGPYPGMYPPSPYLPQMPSYMPPPYPGSMPPNPGYQGQYSPPPPPPPPGPQYQTQGPAYQAPPTQGPQYQPAKAQPQQYPNNGPQKPQYSGPVPQYSGNPQQPQYSGPGPQPPTQYTEKLQQPQYSMPGPQVPAQYSGNPQQPAYPGPGPQYPGPGPQQPPPYAGPNPQQPPQYTGPSPQQPPQYTGPSPQQPPQYTGSNPQQPPQYTGPSPQQPGTQTQYSSQQTSYQSSAASQGSGSTSSLPYPPKQ